MDKSLSLLTPQDRYWARNFKFDLARECKRFGPLPPIRGCGIVPECLVAITDVKKTTWPGAFVHSFKDDYKFDTQNGVWYGMESLIETAKRKKMGLLTPDLSTYSDSHPAICSWNLFRSRLIGYAAEAEGLPVITTLMWWDDESVDFALNGLSPGSVYAVSTIDAARCRQDKETFGRRIRRACAALKPPTLLVYGTAEGIDWGGQKLRVYPNGTYDWLRNRSREV